MELGAEGDIVPCELNLEPETRSPDYCGKDKYDKAGDNRSVPSLEREFVGKETDDDGTDHGSETGKEGYERSSSTVEEDSGDGSLVRVDWRSVRVCLIMGRRTYSSLN